MKALQNETVLLKKNNQNHNIKKEKVKNQALSFESGEMDA